MLSVQQVESDRLNGQLKEQTEKARSMEEQYLAARAEIDRGKKPADTVKAVVKVDAPKAATPAPVQAKPTPAPAQAAPKAARAAPVAAPPPPKKPCNCTAGDPMCGCL